MVRRLLFYLLAACLFFPASSFATAGIIYESGTLGPTGIPRSELGDGTVPGANVSATVFNGVRFQLSVPVLTSQVGGHFVGSLGTSDTFFGAIVELEDENDFPDSDDLSTSDVLGSTVLAFPEPSSEVFGNLALTLDPGWYALVFGSGLFGASGDGAMVLNNPDIGDPSYIGFASSFWLNLSPPSDVVFDDYRFIINGTVIPEPGTFVLTLLLVPLLLCRQLPIQ